MPSNLPRIDVTSPYGKGRIRQLLAHGSVCCDAGDFPKDGYRDVILVFRFGRGGSKTVERKARARWAMNTYPAEWQQNAHILFQEEGARSEIATRRLMVPNMCVARFEPCQLD